MVVTSLRWIVASIVLLLGAWSASSSAEGSGYGFGSFRPLDSAGQSNPRVKQSQTFTQQYSRDPNLFSVPREQTQNGGRPMYRPPQAQGYKFRELPGGKNRDKAELRYRPGSFSGRSPYAWGAEDGRWTDGTLGPAPVYRPIDEKNKKNSAGSSQWRPGNSGAGNQFAPSPYYPGQVYPGYSPGTGSFLPYPFR